MYILLRLRGEVLSESCAFNIRKLPGIFSSNLSKPKQECSDNLDI